MSIYDYKVKAITGKEVSLNEYKGKVLLIVNTASACGLTAQYEELESLYEKYNHKGLEILGFPCNQFGAQEKGNNKEIKEFCELKFGIKFQMFEKLKVNGKNTHPLYKFLKNEAKGILGTKRIKWNFTKFLISKDGKVITRFAPIVRPCKIEFELLKQLERKMLCT